MPKTEFSPDTMTVEATNDEMIQPFDLTRFPVSSTFCIFPPNALLSDPNDTEESLAKETVTIIMDTDGDVLHVYKNGGNSIDMNMMKNCFERSRKRIDEVKSLIQ